MIIKSAMQSYEEKSSTLRNHNLPVEFKDFYLEV